MTGLFRTIFSGTCDRLPQKLSLYVELYDYVEVYGGVWSVMVCSYVVCYIICSCNIFWCILYEFFHLQMGLLFPFLCAKDLRMSLLIMRTRSFLFSFT